MSHKVVIIGSGPSALTAAIYTARAMLKPIVVTGYSMGGQLMTTSEVENFPGYPNGIDGPTLMNDLISQAQKFGTALINENVTSIDSTRRPFIITLGNNEKLETESIIVATGAEALWLNLEGEKKLRGKGISTCAVCDGFFFQGEHLLVIGGGDSAMEEATFLTRFASKVTVVHRRDRLRASKIMVEKAEQNPKIEWCLSSTVREWVANDKGELCQAILDTKDGTKKINCGGAFIAIGHKPAISFLDGQVETDDNGYIIHKNNTMTSVPGIFACGDVVDTRYKQAITAAGDGCKAAMDVEKWLEEQYQPNLANPI